MKNNDKYNNVKELLEQGHKDLVMIGRETGSIAKLDKNVRDSMLKYIKKDETLKLLYDGSFDENKIEDKSIDEKNYYKDNNIATIEGIAQISDWNELVEVHQDNLFIKMIDEKFKSLEYNKNNDKDNNYQNMFVLDDKYNEVGSDEIVTVSLRMTKSAKKMLDRFAQDKPYKKVHITSQLIEEKIKEYL